MSEIQKVQIEESDEQKSSKFKEALGTVVFILVFFWKMEGFYTNPFGTIWSILIWTVVITFLILGGKAWAIAILEEKAEKEAASKEVDQ